MRPVALVCDSAMTCAELVARLAESDADCALVVDAQGKLVGIVTERDVARRITFKAAPDSSLSQVMTAPVKTTLPDERLYRAVAAMRRRELRRLPVVDGDSRPIGLLDARDAIAAASARLLVHLDRLTARDGTPEAQAAVKEAQVGLAADLLRENLPGPQILGLLSRINDDIYRTLTDEAVAAMRDDGWGQPPLPFAVIVMGSGGRAESFLRPDQDNGFILGDYPDADHSFVDRYFYELAERLTAALDRAGFPFCNGGVMATNPLWRMSLSQWRHHLRLWGRRRHPVALLHADIFYDFRAVAGDLSLEAPLRDYALAVVREERDFLRAMSENESHHRVGLGWFSRFVTDDEAEFHQGEMNLKRNGTLPIVESLRLYALREGIAATGTLARLDGLVERKVFSADRQDSLREAYGFIATLLLRRQIEAALAGGKPGNYVHPDSLSSRERTVLSGALKAAEELGLRMKADFTGAIL